jgi:hypothetical protein
MLADEGEKPANNFARQAFGPGGEGYPHQKVLHLVV